MNIRTWFVHSLRRGLPFGLFLIFYVVVFTTLFTFGKNLSGPAESALIAIGIGASLAAVLAGWKFVLAFAPDADYSHKALGYFDVETTVDRRSLGEQLITYRQNLRIVALSYERQRQNLTRISILIAVTLVCVPIVTWCFMLQHAFDRVSYSDTWAAVLSSSTTGAIGLTIAVTILRHVKNSQRPLTEIQERMFDALEAGIAINAANLPAELQQRVLENVLNTLSILRSRQLSEFKGDDGESDKSMLMDVLSAGLKHVSK